MHIIHFQEKNPQKQVLLYCLLSLYIPINEQNIICYTDTICSSSHITSKNNSACQKKNDFTLSFVSMYTSIKVKSKRGRKKGLPYFSFGQHHYNTLHHLQPWRNNQQNNREYHHQQNAMQYIPYFPQTHLPISPSKMILHKVFHLLS